MVKTCSIYILHMLCKGQFQVRGQTYITHSGRERDIREAILKITHIDLGNLPAAIYQAR